MAAISSRGVSTRSEVIPGVGLIMSIGVPGKPGRRGLTVGTGCHAKFWLRKEIGEWVMLLGVVINGLGFEVEAEIFDWRLVLVHHVGCRRT